MNRGFFSAFIALMGVLLLISLIYSNTSQSRLDHTRDTVFLAEQLLAKDHFLARNAFQNFAADAIYDKMKNDNSNGISCPDLSNVDFARAVQSYWTVTSNYMTNNFGLSCTADLDESGDIEIVYEPGCGINCGKVLSNKRSYALLTCTRTVGDITLTLKQPFVIRKVIESTVNAANPAECDLLVADALGVDALPPPKPKYVEVDVMGTI
ncbi:MAG: hypothetical protein Q8P05_05830 [Candidatus Diapherotrites archaeon]|nr:hypothetical protein [Candidatus Diapherotrites archaeon]MDZ4256599.1 hypothetical protein [archaeon]